MTVEAPAGESSRHPSGAGEWRTGWLLVLVAMIAYASATVYSFSLGLFISPLQEEFGWSRASISGGMLLSAVLTAIAAPFVGRLIDVFGSRRIAIPGITIYCVALALLATVSSWIFHWWALWLVIACGTAFTKPTVWVAAVSKSFISQRGIALALTMTGGGLAASITPIVTAMLIEGIGWRGAYVALGVGLAILNLPLLFLFFDKKASSASRTNAAGGLAGMEARQAIMSRRYLQLAVIAFLMTAAMTGTQVHFVPLLGSLGMRQVDAAAAAGMIGLGSIIGRLGTGFLLDRFHGPQVGFIAFLVPVGASLILLLHEGNLSLTATASAFVYGVALGAELDILAYLTGRYFGLKNYGTLFGGLIALVALAAGIGPTLAGLLFDLSGTYVEFLSLTIFMFVGSALLVGTLGRYPGEFGPKSCAV
ncbi:MFS transporter [Sphingobium sp. V4]|uniref:MFS transporter n=1 Tax=Sphingobium sp. V4 TaxID=3038927 RepID=UPI002558073A|nr:MFS transporter [Sphingobium sp. V4]WIW89413.1 MFS transporter [Sphingobium sp. V4]